MLICIIKSLLSDGNIFSLNKATLLTHLYMYIIIIVFSYFSFDDVKHYLQRHLTEVEQSNIMEETDKTELYSLYINCLEVCMSLPSPTQFACHILQLSCSFLDSLSAYSRLSLMFAENFNAFPS